MFTVQLAPKPKPSAATVTAQTNKPRRRVRTMPAVAETQDVKDARAKLLKEKEVEAAATNASRSGVGLRVMVGQTRGQNPQVITWEAFDESKADSLPKTVSEFVSLLKIDPAKDEGKIVSYLITGFNDEAYSTASDPIAEYINPAWDDAKVSAFRLTVRNYAKGVPGATIESAAELLRTAFDKTA